MSIITTLPDNIDEYINYNDLLDMGHIVPVSYQYVDMGSIGKWATCNLGATSPEEVGLYFQWGDTQGYRNKRFKDFSAKDYKFGTGSQRITMTKYNDRDSKFELDLEDDPVHQIMGGNWRMPKYNNVWGLLNLCDSEWIDDYNETGVSGMKFTLDDKTLFFPSCGTLHIDDIISSDEGCCYWYDRFYTSNNIYSYYWTFNGFGNKHDSALNPRYFGLPVRGVLME